MRSSAPDRRQTAGRLRAAGLTPTRRRIDIAHAMFSRGEHVSAERVLALVNRGKGRVSKATVYNTLNLLLEKNLVRQVLVEAGRIFYDPNVEPHHHLYDVDTGELIDVAAGDVRVTGFPRIPAGMTPEGIDIIIRVRSRAA